MKTEIIRLGRRALAALFIILPIAAFGQIAEIDQGLEPSDLGIAKIRFVATPKAGQVAVFRMETESRGVLAVSDYVGFRGGQECVTHVLVQDMGVMDPERKGLWGIRGAFFGGHHENFRLVRSQVKKQSAEYVFEETKNAEKVEFVYRFRIFIASHDEIKALHPELPQKLGNGFSWASGIKFPNKPPKHGNDKDEGNNPHLDTVRTGK